MSRCLKKYSHITRNNLKKPKKWINKPIKKLGMEHIRQVYWKAKVLLKKIGGHLKNIGKKTLNQNKMKTVIAVVTFVSGVTLLSLEQYLIGGILLGVSLRLFYEF